MGVKGGAGEVQGAGVAVVAHKGRRAQTKQTMHDRRHGTWAHGIDRWIWFVRVNMVWCGMRHTATVLNMRPLIIR